jgi:hypothetical protein
MVPEILLIGWLLSVQTSSLITHAQLVLLAYLAMAVEIDTHLHLVNND